MAQILRRVLMISAGVAAVTAEFAMPHAAKGIGLIDTPELQRKCVAVGGEPSHDSDGKSRCYTPAMDERCNQMIAPQYDKDGNRITWVYNVRTDRCEQMRVAFSRLPARRPPAFRMIASNYRACGGSAMKS